MCEPISLSTAIAGASALASAGGAIMNSNAAAANQANAINTKNKAVAESIARQNRLSDEGAALFQNTLQPYQGDAPVKSLQTAQDTGTAAIMANTPGEAALAGGATTGNAPKVVAESENRSIADRVAKLGQNASRIGALTGYDQMGQNNSRAINDSRLKMSNIGTFANQEAMVGNAATNAAVANSQKAPGPFGDILSAAGQLGSFGSGAGWFTDPLAPVKSTPINKAFAPGGRFY